MSTFWTAVMIGAGVGVVVPLLWFLPWLAWGVWDDLTQPSPKQLREHGELVARGFAIGANVSARETGGALDGREHSAA